TLGGLASPARRAFGQAASAGETQMSGPRLEVFANCWYAAPPPLVYRAFTEPELLEQWFCPSADTLLKVERCDVRPSGRYRFVFYFPDQSIVPVLGEYQVVDPPRRLTFTWTWEPPSPWADVVTLVSVSFSAKDGGTDVRVHHERFTAPDMKQSHEIG